MRMCDRMCVLKHLFSLSVAVYVSKILSVPVLAFKSQVKNVVHNLHSKFSHCLLTPGFMYFVFRCLIVSVPVEHVVICDCKLDEIIYL